MQAAKLGKTVIIIDKGPLSWRRLAQLWNDPSKSLREAIIDLNRLYERSFYGKDRPQKNISINDLNYRLNKVLDEQRKMLLKQFEKNNIKLIFGVARFVDPNHLAAG